MNIITVLIKENFKFILCLLAFGLNTKRACYKAAENTNTAQNTQILERATATIQYNKKVTATEQ
jgi:hypothetical protein